MLRLTLACLTTVACSTASAASITDLTQWTLVEDPPHPFMITYPRSADSARVRANGPVLPGTDLGYASINGQDVASSTQGYYFDPNHDFEVAIDFAFLSRSTTGAGVIGFGIGEDVGGADSAGIGLGFLDGVPLAFSTAARVDDIDEPLQLFTTAPDTQPSAGGAINQLAGRFFVAYDSVTADVVLGVSNTPGAGTPDETKTLNGIGNLWDGDDLLVSFFLRSQAIGNLAPGIGGGIAEGDFGPLVILEGTARTAVPEPSTTVLAALALLASWRFPSRR